MRKTSTKTSTLESIAMAVSAIMRLDKCSIEDVFKKFNINDKMAGEIKPLVEKFDSDFNNIFDKVDAMSDKEFKKFVERMKK